MKSLSRLKPYALYFGRLVLVVLGIAIVGILIWYIARQADTADDVSVDEGIAQESESEGVVQVPEVIDPEENEEASEPEPVREATQPQVAAATDDLPNTGPEDVLYLMAVPLFVYSLHRYINSRKLVKEYFKK